MATKDRRVYCYYSFTKHERKLCKEVCDAMGDITPCLWAKFRMAIAEFKGVLKETFPYRFCEAIVKRLSLIIS